PLDHALFHGPPGLGKTTLAYLIAQEMGVSIRVTSGPAIEKPGEMASLLTLLEPRDIFFIDEIHRLSRVVEEVLYPAMEEGKVDVVVPGKGPGGARMLRIPLKPFTLIGATTRFGMLSPPLRERFGAVYRLEFYTQQEIEAMLNRSTRLLRVKADHAGIAQIALRARGTPRIANRLLRRVRDYAQVVGDGVVTEQVARDALAKLEVDPLGLDLVDLKLLRTVIEKFNGGPVGLETVAAATSEDVDTVTDVYEPFLLQLGFLERTPRGRVVTRRAYEHLGVPYDKEKPPNAQGSLL
ncbi:MAG: Holliday junction branch migration DNA helicase RuvB, partial [Chloroflexi bacterium]|nr:Holliday junction branch migration DNA helicase RuvB [Chloroflexota bacterium]